MSRVKKYAPKQIICKLRGAEIAISEGQKTHCLLGEQAWKIFYVGETNARSWTPHSGSALCRFMNLEKLPGC